MNAVEIEQAITTLAEQDFDELLERIRDIRANVTPGRRGFEEKSPR